MRLFFVLEEVNFKLAYTLYFVNMNYHMNTIFIIEFNYSLEMNKLHFNKS